MTANNSTGSGFTPLLDPTRVATQRLTFEHDQDEVTRACEFLGVDAATPPRDIGAILLTGAQALFLKLSPA